DDFFDLIVLHLLRRTTTSRRLLLHGSGLTAAWGRRTCSRLRLALFVELDELVLARRHFRNSRTAFEHRIGDTFGVELNRTHGVVVAGNYVIDVIGRAVRVDDRDDRNAELFRFIDRDALVTDVDDEQQIGERLHLFDAAQAALELLALAAQPLSFALAVLLERAVLRHLVERHQALDPP